MRALGLVGLLVACGDGIALPDASAPIDTGERGLVTVHVIGSTDDPIYFQNADSTLVLATRTNRAGEASAVMAPGGFVSVVKRNVGIDSPQLFTWTDVQIGDELTLFWTADGPDTIGTTPLAPVIIAAFDGAANYFLHTPCEATSVAHAVDMEQQVFFAPCASVVDLLLVAQDLNGDVIGYRQRKSANIAATATLDLRGPYLPLNAAIDLTAYAHTSVDVSQRINGLQYQRQEFLQIGKEQHVVIQSQVPAITGTTVQTVGRDSSGFFPGKEDAETTVFSRSAEVSWGPAATTTAVDLIHGFPHGLTAAPTFDTTSNTLRWGENENDSGVATDIVWARIGFAGMNWLVIGRPTGAELRLPVLPQRDLQPTQLEVFISQFALIAAEGGYDRYRPYLLGNWGPSTFGSEEWPMTAPTGHVRYRTLF